jgi:lipoprotein-releasing system permease protein
MLPLQKIQFAWDIFRHYLLSRRAGSLIRTVAWLCMCGVGLGVMALVVVTSVMNGFNDQIRRRLLAVEPHLIVKVPHISQAEALKNHPVFKDLSERVGVRAEVYESQEVIIRTVDGLFQGAIGRGVEPGTLGYMMREAKKAMSSKVDVDTPPVSDETMKLAPGEVFLGIDLARAMGIFEGDKLTVIPPEALLLPQGEAPPFERVTVKGFLQTNIEDIDGNMIFFGRGQTFSTFRGSPSREVGIEVRIPDPENVDDLKKELQSKGAVVETWIDRNSALFYALRMEKIAMSVFLGLAALIASFSIVTVLVLLLTQKRKDIGLLMALGLSPTQTRWLFVRVGLLLSSFGILAGLIVGLAICVVVNKYPLPILPDYYYDATIPATIDARFIVGILIAAAVIAYISADLPARSSTAELPSEALRSQRQNHAKPQ